MLWRDRQCRPARAGSTIKSFVVARALEERVLRRDELLYCEHGLWSMAAAPSTTRIR